MTLPYKAYNEFQDRYSGTVIYRGDDPVYVRSVLNGIDGDPRQPGFEISQVGKRVHATVVSAWEQDLRDHPFRLGYVNDVDTVEVTDGEIEKFKSVAYCRRVPLRRWKQGLTELNTEFSGALSFQKALSHKGFRDMLMGVYPTIEQAVKKIDEDTRMIAFHPKLAIGLNDLEDFTLNYRGSVIGSSDDYHKFKLGKRFNFLQEYLEANGVQTW